MTDTIFNEDGSVYMTFGPVQPRKDPLAYTVRHVRAQDNPPGTVWDTGTHGTVERSTMAYRDVCLLRSRLTAIYGTPPSAVASFGYDTPEGRRYAYRYTWERLTTWRGRVTDTLWITR